MDSNPPPQIRRLTNNSSSSTQIHPSVWNKLNDPMSSPTSFDPRYASASAMPQTPSNTQSWRAVVSPNALTATLPSPRVSPEVVPSVKHLTCYFWNAHGKCKHSDEDCLYAHFHTGQIADPPVQVEPGRPAVAGRNAMTARPVYENWRDQHGNTNGVVNMPTAMHPRISNQVENLHVMARRQSIPQDVLPRNGNYQYPNSFQHGHISNSPNFVHEPTHDHQRTNSSASEPSYDRMTGNLCAIAGDLFNTAEKSHNTFAHAVVALHAQCETLLNTARALYRDNDPKPKAAIEALVGAVTSIMPLIDEQKAAAAETEEARQGVLQSMHAAGLGYMAHSWQATAPSESSGSH